MKQKSQDKTKRNVVSPGKQSKAKNWLITGGCGFIGANLIKALQARVGVRIRVLDNLSVGSKELLGSVCRFRQVPVSKMRTPRAGDRRVQLVVGDILDSSLMEKVARGMDVIVHLAANTGVGPSVEDPRSDCTTNVLGILNCLEAARHAKVKRFVFASSGAPVGECKPPIHEEIAPHPVSPYGASKLAGEGYCSAYFRTFGVETVALRFGNVYGPYSDHKNSVVAKFIKLALAGTPVEIFGDGKQTRDFVHVEDLVRAILAASKAKRVGGEVFQIATHRETTVTEIAREISSISLRETGKKLQVIHGDSRIGDVKRNFSDIRKARKKLGFVPRLQIRKGLLNTWHYFKNAAVAGR